MSQNLQLASKLVIITGANRGIGLATAKHFASQGADVVLACRRMDLAQNAIETEIKPHMLAVAAKHQPAPSSFTSPQRIIALPLQLDSFNSTHQFVDLVKAEFGNTAPFALINNSAVMLKERAVTADGLEQTMQVNFLSPMLLSLRIMRDWVVPSHSPEFRLIYVNANAHKTGKLNFDDFMMENGYDGWGAYVRSKLALITFANGLQRAVSSPVLDNSLAFLKNQNVFPISVDPGWIKTDLVRRDHGFLEAEVKSKMGGGSTDAGIAADAIMHAALFSPPKGGIFLSKNKEVRPSAVALDVVQQDQLWKKTKQLIQWQ